MDKKDSMELKAWKEGNTRVISVKGRLDATTSPGFEQAIEGFIHNGENMLIIDLKDLEYISSAGLRSILVVTKLVKERNGDLYLSSLQVKVKEVFDISGFNAIIPVYGTMESAMKDMKK